MRVSRAWATATAAFIAVLSVAGAWHVGSGAWIYAKARLAQVLLQRAWAGTLQGRQVKPWPWADTWPVARLKVPRLGVDQIVLEDATGRTLAFGPGHVASSPLPGQEGVAILSGHRDRHFRFLRRLAAGDEIVVETAARGPTRYHVTDRTIVNAADGAIRTERWGRTLVLVTCYPFDAVIPGGPLRYVVTAESE